jgi:hypothetical protein
MIDLEGDLKATYFEHPDSAGHQYRAVVQHTDNEGARDPVEIKRCLVGFSSCPNQMSAGWGCPWACPSEEKA